jgi:translation initiation factor 1
MPTICPRCGLAQELCMCETIAKEEQQIRILTVKRRFGKIITVIEGIDAKDINLKDVAKTLKSKLACGGTVKGNTIELQGDHASKARDELIIAGFASETIKTNPK